MSGSNIQYRAGLSPRLLTACLCSHRRTYGVFARKADIRNSEGVAVGTWMNVEGHLDDQKCGRGVIRALLTLTIRFGPVAARKFGSNGPDIRISEIFVYIGSHFLDPVASLTPLFGAPGAMPRIASASL